MPARLQRIILDLAPSLGLWSRGRCKLEHALSIPLYSTMHVVCSILVEVKPGGALGHSLDVAHLNACL